MKIVTFASSLILIAFATNGVAQTVVTNGIILNNDKSNIRIVNPNTTGSFILQLPTIPALQPGEQQELVLRMTGSESGTQLSFEPQTSNLVAVPDQSLQRIDITTPRLSPLQKVVLTYAEIDLPSVMAGEAFVVKLNEPTIKAGAAITISPAGEMPTGLFPAFAWCPIDCVVMVKFMNIGPTQVDLPAMQFAIGAINPE